MINELIQNKILGGRAGKIINELKNKYKKIEFLDRGRHSVILLLDRKYVAKIEKDIPAGKDSAKKEAYWLKVLNKYKISPIFFYYNPELRYAVYEYIKGSFIKDKINSFKKDEFKKIILLTLKKARTLDKLKINKEEMHKPVKHIIITNKDALFIDFERAKKTKNPKNVSQLLHYYLLNKADIRINFEKEKALELIREYKKAKNKEAVFKRISNLIERQ